MSNERMEDKALAAANEIAEQFAVGFFDDRMVRDVAAIIKRHVCTTSHQQEKGNEDDKA